VTKLQDKKLKVCVTILHLGRDFVTGNFYSILPVPNIHHHVVLSTDRQYILQVWSKSLHTDISDIHYSRKKIARQTLTRDTDKQMSNPSLHSHVHARPTLDQTIFKFLTYSTAKLVQYREAQSFVTTSRKAAN